MFLNYLSTFWGAVQFILVFELYDFTGMGVESGVGFGIGVETGPDSFTLSLVPYHTIDNNNNTKMIQKTITMNVANFDVSSSS